VGEAVAEPPAVARAVRPTNSFAPIGAKGGWSIQLGSFASAANADKLARTLRGKGIRVYVSSQGGKHRVRAGPFPDRTAADRAAAKLKSQGQSVSIIAP
jgi:DedD protein